MQHFVAAPQLGLLFDPNLGGTMVVSLNSPQEMADNSEQGVSVWLYMVNKDSERLNDPMERINSTQLRRRPLPLSLHYLVTPIVITKNKNSNSETEQIILGKVLQVMHDHPVLDGSTLRDDFTGLNIRLHAHLEPTSVEENTRLFDALERSYQLSVSYQVSLVMIDSEHEPLATSPVGVVNPNGGTMVGA